MKKNYFPNCDVIATVYIKMRVGRRCLYFSYTKNSLMGKSSNEQLVFVSGQQEVDDSLRPKLFKRQHSIDDSARGDTGI